MCHWCSCHILTSSVICYWTNTRQHGIYLFYTIKNIQLQLFISKSFSDTCTQKPAFAHFGKHDKKPFDIIFCLYKMKQFHWLLYITRNCDWSRKITPLSNLTQMASRGMKMLKKMLEKSTQFLSSEQPCGVKSLSEWMFPWTLLEFK